MSAVFENIGQQAADRRKTESYEQRTKNMNELSRKLAQSRLDRYNVMATETRNQKKILARLEIERIGQVRLKHTYIEQEHFHVYFCPELPSFIAGGKEINQIVPVIPELLSDSTVILFGGRCTAVKISPAEVQENSDEILFLISPKNE